MAHNLVMMNVFKKKEEEEDQARRMNRERNSAEALFSLNVVDLIDMRDMTMKSRLDMISGLLEHCIGIGA